MCKLTLGPDGYESPDNISARFHPSSYVRQTAANLSVLCLMAAMLSRPRLGRDRVRRLLTGIQGATQWA